MRCGQASAISAAAPAIAPELRNSGRDVDGSDEMFNLVVRAGGAAQTPVLTLPVGR